MRRLYRIPLYAWALPATLCGLVFVPFVLLSGGSARIVAGVVEVHGGLAARLFQRGLPWVGPVSAMTIGHVVFGCDAARLAATRAHERVHVRQYERWGLFFLPAYFAAGLLLRVRRKNPYRDNPFEVEARAKATVPDNPPRDSLGPGEKF